MSNLQVDINEIALLLKAIELAINRKVYTKQEIGQYFPLWNTLTASIEKIKRQAIVDQMYAEPVPEPVPEPVSESVVEEEKVIKI